MDPSEMTAAHDGLGTSDRPDGPERPTRFRRRRLPARRMRLMLLVWIPLFLSSQSTVASGWTHRPLYPKSLVMVDWWVRDGRRKPHHARAFSPNPREFVAARPWTRAAEYRHDSDHFDWAVAAATTLSSSCASRNQSDVTDQDNMQTRTTLAEFQSNQNMANKHATPEDYTGAGTLGDIMSRPSSPTNATTTTTATTTLPSTSFSGLVTSEGGLLQESFGVVSPLDRMALTANGNLQRLFSSYYDQPVHVVVDHCTLSSLSSSSLSRASARDGAQSSQQWDRTVHLMVHNQTFCTAKSNITVHDPICQALVSSGKVGLGQLFRYLDKLPNFALLEAGYSAETGGLWRVYQLSCDEVSCLIREDFCPFAWEKKSQHDER